LLKKLGVVHITHAKDGLEGKFPMVVELIVALDACKKEKFSLCFMGKVVMMNDLIW
jgi:hypothetical protein